MSRVGRWLAAKATWPNTMRGSGLAGIAFLVVFRAHPDSTIVIALVSMMGLPSFISLDLNRSTPQGGPPVEHHLGETEPPSGGRVGPGPGA